MVTGVVPSFVCVVTSMTAGVVAAAIVVLDSVTAFPEIHSVGLQVTFYKFTSVGENHH